MFCFYLCFSFGSTLRLKTEDGFLRHSLPRHFRRPRGIGGFRQRQGWLMLSRGIGNSVWLGSSWRVVVLAEVKVSVYKEEPLHLCWPAKQTTFGRPMGVLDVVVSRLVGGVSWYGFFVFYVFRTTFSLCVGLPYSSFVSTSWWYWVERTVI